jgi:hypothetical protein
MASKVRLLRRCRLRAVLRFAAGHHDLKGPDGKVASEALGTLRLWVKPKRKKTIVRDMLAWHAAVGALPQERVRDLLMVGSLVRTAACQRCQQD